MNGSSPECYTIEEMTELVRGLSDADVHRLERMAWYLVKKCWVKPEDLLSESLFRSLDGKRKCKKVMSIVPFLYGVMRSISNEWRERLDKDKGKPDPARWGSDPVVEVDTLPDVRPNALDILEAQELQERALKIRVEVEKMFEGDEKAWLVIQADMEGGMTPDDICGMLSVDRREYDTIRKRIRRGFEKICARFPEARP